MIDGVQVFASKMIQDDRGFFCVTEEGPGSRRIIARSYHKGTLRGLHYRPGAGESKLVRCSAGRICDVTVDLRPLSRTYKNWTMIYLSGSSQSSIYIPAGCAHGYQTLEDNTDVTYRIDADYEPDAELAIKWDDPELDIEWPLPVAFMSDRDRNAPSLEETLWNLA